MRKGGRQKRRKGRQAPYRFSMTIDVAFLLGSSLSASLECSSMTGSGLIDINSKSQAKGFFKKSTFAGRNSAGRSARRLDGGLKASTG